MRNLNTFGVHFILRRNRPVEGKYPIYARISVNKSRCELALKSYLHVTDWKDARGLAKPKTDTLKELNGYLEEVRSKLVTNYQELELNNTVITPETVNAAYLGKLENPAGLTASRQDDLKLISCGERGSRVVVFPFKSYFSLSMFALPRPLLFFQV